MTGLKNGPSLSLGLKLIINAYQEITKILAPDRVAEVQFSALVKDAVSTPYGGMVAVNANQSVTLTVPDNLRSHHNNYVIDAVAGGELWSLAVKSFLVGLLDPTKASWAAAAGFAASGALLIMKARAEYDQAVDPPDPDYTRIATPERLSIPAVEDLPAGPYKELAQTALELQAVHRAASISRDRAVGAGLAGDAYWESRQFSVAADFTATVAQLEARLAAIFSRIQPVLSANLSPYEGQVAPFLEANGLPEPLAQVLSQFGWSAEQAENLRQNLILMASGGDEDPSLISGILKISTLMSSSIAENDLRSAVEIRVNRLGQAVRELEPDERHLLDGMRVDIESDLAHGVQTTSLGAAIETFLGEVRRLTLLTNNPTALQSDIDFGNQALANYVNLIAAPPVSPPGDTTPPVVVTARLVSLTRKKGPTAKSRKSTGVAITFSEDVGGSAALNLASYSLSSGKKVRKRGIVFNKRLALASAAYDPTTHTVMITLRSKAVPHGPLQLIARGGTGLADLAGNLFDGDRDGRPGGEFVTRLR
jgi:hypothetical protein